MVLLVEPSLHPCPDVPAHALRDLHMLPHLIPTHLHTALNTDTHMPLYFPRDHANTRRHSHTSRYIIPLHSWASLHALVQLLLHTFPRVPAEQGKKQSSGHAANGYGKSKEQAERQVCSVEPCFFIPCRNWKVHLPDCRHPAEQAQRCVLNACLSFCLYGHVCIRS